jgi:hypothetical protein
LTWKTGNSNPIKAIAVKVKATKFPISIVAMYLSGFEFIVSFNLEKKNSGFTAISKRDFQAETNAISVPVK